MAPDSDDMIPGSSYVDCVLLRPMAKGDAHCRVDISDVRDEAGDSAGVDTPADSGIDATADEPITFNNGTEDSYAT